MIDWNTMLTDLTRAGLAIGSVGVLFFLAGFSWASGVIKANQYANGQMGKLIEQGRNIERTEQMKKQQEGGGQDE